MTVSKTFLIALFAILAYGAGSPIPAASGRSDGPYLVETKDLAVELSADGRITGLVIKKDGSRRAVTGETRLAGCAVQGPIAARTIKDGAVEFEKTLTDARGNTGRLIERFTPLSDSVRWEIEIRGAGKPWSAAIETALRFPEPWTRRFWSPWGDSRQGRFLKTDVTENKALGILPDAPVGDWGDPLVPMPFTEARLWFGAPAFTYDDPGLAFIPFRPDLFGIPLATVIEPENDLGISLVLSPADPYLDMTLTTSAAGGIAFARFHHRIQDKAALKFAADLVLHEGDWRGGLRWMAARYPEYFDPAAAVADELAGTGAYSAFEGPLDAAKMKKMAFRTNWKASWDFPYMGVFLPPVKPGESWTRFGGGPTSIAGIRDYCRRMREQGFFVLNYFNVTEFGAKILWPPPAPQPLSEADQWKDANTFLYGKMREAILYVPARVKPESLKIYPKTRLDGPYYTWEGGIILDAGEPVYRDFLLDQARRHVEAFPESSGICIDRMDWLRMYNEQRDDGASWFEDKPVRSLNNSWRDLMSKLAPIMHQAGKAIFVNNHTKRIDLLRGTDGFFDEFTYRGVPLNLTALLGIRKSVLGWTDSAEDLRADPDAFFHKYLYLGVYPMAPYPDNDHSLEAGGWVERVYLDYGPLLDAMRGKKWVLAPHACSVDNGGAKANVFQVPAGYAVPVVFGGKKKSVRVVLRGLDGMGINADCLALHPGRENGVPVTLTKRGADLILDVPLVRGCAMVRIRRR